MVEVSIFSCKDVSPKRVVALQILAYSTISVLRELFESEPSTHMKLLADFESFIESVDILPEVWEKIRAQNIFTEEEKVSIFNFLRSIEENLLAVEDLEIFELQILEYLAEVPEDLQICNELFEEGKLSEEKTKSIMGLFVPLSLPLSLSQTLSLPLPQARGRHTTRSKTLRVNGRRGLTPMRPSKKKTKKTNTS
jgi:hypothetical protein